jgi:curved DNA-binding protein CbpA
MTSLYSILGVGRDATADEIKKAWRRFSKDNHPDKGGDKEVFQLGQHAYEILSNPAKRQIYDETGDAGFANGRRQEVERGIIDVINAVIEGNGERGSIINSAKEIYRGKIPQFKRQGESAAIQLERYKRIRSRLRFKPLKEGERDIITEFFDVKEAGCQSAIAQAKQCVEMAEESLKLLDQWEDAGAPESLYWAPIYGSQMRGPHITFSQT